MYLLYADESGTIGDKNQEIFILAGISVFERQTHWLSQELDNIVRSIHIDMDGNIELHGSPMFGGKKEWRKIPKSTRIQAIKDALSLIDGKKYRIFASVVNRHTISPANPISYTFEQLITRFDYFLARQYQVYNKPQRGLVIFDKSKEESHIQSLAYEFKVDGHQWGSLRNLAEVPLFIDSQSSRLIQLADLVAYAIFRNYQFDDEQFFEIIKDKFDFFNQVQHGLHVTVEQSP